MFPEVLVQLRKSDLWTPRVLAVAEGNTEASVIGEDVEVHRSHQAVACRKRCFQWSVIYGNGSMNCQGGQLLESMESVKTNFSDEMTALKRIGREPIALIGARWVLTRVMSGGWHFPTQSSGSVRGAPDDRRFLPFDPPKKTRQ